MALTVKGERLWQSLMDLAKIGATPKGGSARLALTAEDGRGRDLVVAWMRGAGLRVTIDRIGNIFGRRAGRDDALPPILFGSHIDTQPTGGKFDGCFGALSALEVIRTLNDFGIATRRPLEMAIWTNEEGSRFVPTMMGSGAFAGLFPLREMLDTADREGRTVGDELKAIACAGDAPVGGRPVGAYLEAHIEQGPLLERENKIIGVVIGCLGLRWYDATITGVDGHAGANPMPMRKDALLGASALIQSVVRAANERAPYGRGTVGSLRVFPDSRNVIPGRVEMSVDIRHFDDAALSGMREDLLRAARDLESGALIGAALDVTLDEFQYSPPAFFDGRLLGFIRDEAAIRGYSQMDIVSGAGHDAIPMSTIAPTAMIFIPCKDGLSHNELESIEPEHAAAGCNVLLGAVRKAAEMD
ncbi:MAG: Zn-dependent hydrolase [Azoarcus sp.]|jgi:N-carbamoyl-L-amino-acid hydrolase|nr:Zn-dependent hydrolase [Azoarcus sp.]